MMRSIAIASALAAMFASSPPVAAQDYQPDAQPGYPDQGQQQNDAGQGPTDNPYGSSVISPGPPFQIAPQCCWDGNPPPMPACCWGPPPDTTQDPSN
jgi:hypothetical protein